MSLPALAVNDAMMDLLKILRDKGSLTQVEYDLLRNAARADKDKLVAANQDIQKDLEKQITTTTENLPKVTLKGKFKIESQRMEHIPFNP